jgi:hypothetical protein
MVCGNHSMARRYECAFPRWRDRPFNGFIKISEVFSTIQ